MWVSTQGNQSPGTVTQQLEVPRSYTVQTPTGQVRRNRRDLRLRSENTNDESTETGKNENQNSGVDPQSQGTRVIQTQSRTGTSVLHQIDFRTKQKREMWNNVLCDYILYD